MNMAVEFPVKIFRKCPIESLGLITDPKLKLKLTMYIPKMA
jgi:hypothetical protein